MCLADMERILLNLASYDVKYVGEEQDRTGQESQLNKKDASMKRKTDHETENDVDMVSGESDGSSNDDDGLVKEMESCGVTTQQEPSAKRKSNDVVDGGQGGSASESENKLTKKAARQGGEEMNANKAVRDRLQM
jgi:hypothetical protein